VERAEAKVVLARLQVEVLEVLAAVLLTVEQVVQETHQAHHHHRVITAAMVVLVLILEVVEVAHLRLVLLVGTLPRVMVETVQLLHFQELLLPTLEVVAVVVAQVMELVVLAVAVMVVGQQV
jgi:hypothetical protein